MANVTDRYRYYTKELGGDLLYYRLDNGPLGRPEVLHVPTESWMPSPRLAREVGIPDNGAMDYDEQTRAGFVALLEAEGLNPPMEPE